MPGARDRSCTDLAATSHASPLHCCVIVFKMTAELFESAPTIKAMGREAEFEKIVNDETFSTACSIPVSRTTHCMLY